MIKANWIVREFKKREKILNIGYIIPKSLVNGPGKRFVIWLQGCPFHCQGCINPELWSFTPNKLYSIEQMLKLLFSTSGVEGVTLSGGEPFEQAYPLYFFTKEAKKHGLSIMSYSGYTFKELCNKKDRYVHLLLSQLDILIDGKFELDKAAHLLWRGSKNQKVHFLSNRYKNYISKVDNEDLQIEFHLQEGKMFLTGNFDWELLKAYEKKLKELGILIDLKGLI